MCLIDKWKEINIRTVWPVKRDKNIYAIVDELIAGTATRYQCGISESEFRSILVEMLFTNFVRINVLIPNNTRWQIKWLRLSLSFVYFFCIFIILPTWNSTHGSLHVWRYSFSWNIVSNMRQQQKWLFISKKNQYLFFSLKLLSANRKSIIKQCMNKWSLKERFLSSDAFNCDR